MRNVIMTAVLPALLSALAAAQDLPKPEKEHEWLQQMAGEWDTEGEFVVEPGKPPIKNKGTESSRLLGGFWISSEHKGEFLGAPFTGMLTLGYSPEKKKYVATWIDSTGSHMWHYLGSLDAGGKKLTLETEGPGHDGKTAKFREAIEIQDKDHKVFTSSTEKDGAWVTFATIRYTRKK